MLLLERFAPRQCCLQERGPLRLLTPFRISVPPAFAPPAPAPVVDTDSAEAFAEGYAIRQRSAASCASVAAASVSSMLTPPVSSRPIARHSLRLRVHPEGAGHPPQPSGGTGGMATATRRRKSSKRGDHACVVVTSACGATAASGSCGSTAGRPPRRPLRSSTCECARIPRGDMEVVAPTDAPADNSWAAL